MQFEALDTDAEFRRVVDQIVNMGGMEQLFGWDAASQQTRAAEVFIFFDDRCFQTDLRSPDGRHITSGACADNCDIKSFRHSLLLKNPLGASRIGLIGFIRPVSPIRDIPGAIFIFETGAATCQSLTLSTARKASCGISTLPTRFMRFLPSFCFSSSLRLR